MNRMLPDEELILTPEFKHYGKVVKKTTGKFVRWATAPNKMSHRERSKQAIEAVQNISLPIAQSIVKYYNEHGKITPKQLEVLQSIVKTYR